MSIQIKKGFKQLMQEANAQVESIDVQEAMALAKSASSNIQFIDVRDGTELKESGKIVGAEHASRGMLEFLVDPESPYHNKIFDQDKKFIVYCASGGRSALAAQRIKEMGIDNVCTLAGGLKAWCMEDGALEAID
ncbi:MAG: rhodanese-like domain-containing protein [Candidatus Oxydemutatoraceae bacterium WSBS_2016_MAG_OTU14]